MAYFDSLSLATGILGIFIAVPLYQLRDQRKANVFLGHFLLSFSLLCFASTSHYFQNTSIFGLLDWTLACLGPCFYLYVSSVAGGAPPKRVWLHFIPTGMFVLYLLGLRIFDVPPRHFGAILLGVQIYTAIYALASIVRVVTFRSQLKENFSNTQARDLSWVIWLSLWMLCLLFVWIPATQLLGGKIWGGLLVVGRLGVLFFVGWYGLRQKEVFIPTPLGGANESDKYSRSGMTEAVKAKISQGLYHRINAQKDYLQNDLKLIDLAQGIGTSPQLLSEYINQVEGKTFFQYINGYRVDEAKRLFAEHPDRAVLDIAFDSGFNSKSTFNSAFKNVVGLSPSKWKFEKNLGPNRSAKAH